MTSALILALLLLGSGPSVPQTDDAAFDAALYATAIRQAAKEARCTAETPCCYGVKGKPPRRELVELLKGVPGLKPVPGEAEATSCDGLSLDARRTARLDRAFEAVDVRFGHWPVADPVFMSCLYSLRKTDAGWAVVTSETACPVQ